MNMSVRFFVSLVTFGGIIDDYHEHQRSPSIHGTVDWL